MFDVLAVEELCRKAGNVEIELASDDELLTAAVSLQRAMGTLAAANARVLGEAHARSVTDIRYGTTTSRWVAAQAGVEAKQVRAQVLLGRRLRRMPPTEAAMSAGSISAGHGEVLARAAANPRVGDEVLACQDALIEMAAGSTFERWSAAVHRLEQTLDQDGGYDPGRDLATNKLRFHDLPDGSMTFGGELTQEHALVLRQGVEAEADRLFHRFRNDAEQAPASLPMPSRSTLLALALTELVVRGLGRNPATTRRPTTDVTLVVTANPPAEHDGAPTSNIFGPVTTIDGANIRSEVAATLSCDPRLHVLVVDTLGVALDLGRSTRFANRAQRRALARRDGGCVFPGCSEPVSWCDAHHVVPWERAGRTDLANLALVCRHHHGVTHRTGWTMGALPDQTFRWTTPLGETLISQRHHNGRPPPG